MRLYGKYMMIQLKSTMEYKASFFLACLGQFVVSFHTFLGVYFMFRRFHSVEGFTYEEVLLCFSITLMEFSMAEMFARGFDTFSQMVKTGGFDRIMVRPRNEILQVLGSRFDFSRLGRLFQAAMMLAYVIFSGSVDWTPAKIVTLLFMLLGGTAVFSGFFLLYAAICFFTLEGLEFMNIFTDGAREYGRYPISVYGRKALLFSTFVIPYALIQYYPLLFLLDRGKVFYRYLPLLSCFFLLPCYLAWRIGVRHYHSCSA